MTNTQRIVNYINKVHATKGIPNAKHTFATSLKKEKEKAEKINNLTNEFILNFDFEKIHEELKAGKDSIIININKEYSEVWQVIQDRIFKLLKAKRITNISTDGCKFVLFF